MAELAASSRGAPRDAGHLPGRRSFRGGPSPAPIAPCVLDVVHRLVVAAAVVVLVVASALVVFRGRYDGKVMPSVVVADVAVGGLSREEATMAVADRAQALLGASMTFSYDGKTWSPTLSDLGVSADPATSVDAAFAVGRESGARARLLSSFDVSHETTSIQLPMAVDRAAADRWADAVTDELGLAPQDARIDVDGADVTLVSDVDGIVVDTDRLRDIVDESIATMSPYDGPLPIVSVPADVKRGDLQSSADRLATALGEPITIVYKKKRWTLRPADLAQFVEQRKQEDGPGITVDIDRDALADYLRSLIADAINRDAVDATVAWNVDRLGVVERSRDGLRIRPDSLAQDVADSFFGDHDAVSIPVRVLKPAIDDDHLEDLHIDQELGRGSSNFQGSNDGRATNVIVGTEHLNGAMVAPGADFSFNEAIGDITEEAGYVEASVIQGERIGKDIGGGICQVSTTVFRAAYQVGMPMVEWNPHLYRLGFYELDGYQPGLDASILQEGPREDWGDFRFNNPTDGWLLVEAYIVDTQVVVIIYGPKTNWDITFSDPIMSDEGLKAEDQDPLEIVDEDLEPGTVEQSELALDGLEVTYHRVVKTRDGTVISDRDFYTRFAPRGDVYKVSPDMVGESPASNPADEPDDTDEATE